MYTKKTSLTLAILMAGGALTFAVAGQQPGQQPGQQDDAESVRLNLRLTQGATHRYEVTETRARTAETGLPGDSQRGARPGQTGGVQDGTQRDSSDQHPGTRPQPGQPVAAGQTSVTSYEIKVPREAEAGSRDAGVTKLEVKMTKRMGALPAQRSGLDRNTDFEQERGVDRERDPLVDRDRGALGQGERATTFIVHVTRTGEIREIHVEGKDKDKDKDKDKADMDPAERARLEREWGGRHDDGTASTDVVRDHLHAILGTGLHERELRKGEIVHLGMVATPTGRPVEAGTGSDEVRRDSGRQGGIGQEKDKHQAGVLALHKDKVKLTGVGMEFQAVERRGQESLARFRLLDHEAVGMRDLGTGGQQPGREPSMQDPAQGTGVASFRTSDGLLEELTYLPRAGTMMDPIGDRPGFGEKPRDEHHDRGGDLGTQDRDRDVGVDAMLNRQSITIRRVES